MLKKILKGLMVFALSLTIFVPTVTAKANDNSRASVCEVITANFLKSKRTYVVFDTVKTVQNGTATQQVYPISLTRIKSTTYSGTLDFEIIEDLIGISAEVSANNSKEVTAGQDVTVPKYTTYYAAFGSKYVTAQVQRATINSNCSRTWSGPIYTTTYTYDDYIGIYEIELEKDKEYTISYLDSLNKN